MNAKEKIERLTNQWYGFALFSGVATLLMNGIGFFSLLFAGLSTLTSFTITWFVGRRLLARSTFWRYLLIVTSTLGVFLGTLGGGGLVWRFFGDWSLNLLIEAGFAFAAVVMNARSWRVLTDSSVRAYFG